MRYCRFFNTTLHKYCRSSAHDARAKRKRHILGVDVP